MEQLNYFGEHVIKTSRNDLEGCVEQIKIQGYTILNNVLSEQQANFYAALLDKVYATQCEEVGGEGNLTKTGELGVARNLVDYKREFSDLISHADVLSILIKLMGNYFTLMYQSGIINTPHVKKYPSNWHRDLIHQNFTSSKPLAVTVIFCIDDFTLENGGTVLIPFSHKLESVPSAAYLESNQLKTVAKKGSILIADSMLLHKTGDNISNAIRRAIVNVYALPFINQPFYFAHKTIEGIPAEQQGLMYKLLGFMTRPQPSLVDYRKNRLS